MSTATKLPPSSPIFPYPKTERQATFIALADQLAAEAAAQAPANDRDNSFPHDTFACLREAGYLALTVPEAAGGRGATAIELMLAQERLARGDGSVALSSTMHLTIVGGLAAARPWPEPLFARLCREIVVDGALINTAASEPDLGSPSRGGPFATTATAVPGGWRLDGRKTWATLSPALRYAIVQATVLQGEAPPGRGSFLVPLTTDGVQVEETWDNLAMRGTGSNDLVLDGVFVPGDSRLPDGPGPVSGNWALVTSAVYLGIAVAARDFAVDYAVNRRPSGLGESIATLQTVQHRIAQMEILLFQARSVLYGAAETYEARPDLRPALAWQFAAAKYTATNHAIKVTDLALRVVGSMGLSRRLPLERYFRDVRAGTGNPPLDDVALTLIGKSALGIS